LALIWVSVGACSKPPAQVPETPVVASVGDRRFTRAEVEALLQAEPDFMRARYATPERKREFVETLVRNELLLQEARRRQLDQRPEVKLMVERILIQQLLANAAEVSEPGEAEARRFYDEHATEFTRAERVEVAVIEFGPRGTVPPASQAEVEKELAALRKQPRSSQAAAFEALVLARSTHEGSRAAAGQLGLRTREELAALFSQPVADGAFSSGNSGEISNALQGPRGWVLLRVSARQPSEVKSFESERPRIITRLMAEHRSKALDDLVRSLREKATVTVDASAIDSLDPKPPRGALVP
jgi:parvulin-like peptidyl-prolyl isomerase